MADADDWVVYLFSPHDISTVPATTESHYVATRFGERFDTHVFAPLSSSLPGTTGHTLARGGLLGLLLLNLLYFPKYLWLAVRSPPDVVYCYRNVFLPAFVFKYASGSTVVYDFQVDPYSQPKEFNTQSPLQVVLLECTKVLHRLAVSRADLVITLSEPLMDKLTENLAVPSEKMQLVPLGVDPDEFTVVESTGSGFRIGYLGSMKRYRGIETLVDAVGVAFDDADDVTLELFGPIDDAYRAELQQRADDRSVSVNWHGMIPHGDVAERVGACDAVVSPLPAHESYQVSSPAKVYEYLGLGLPIVATDIQAHRRILDHEEDALLVPPDDPERMGHAIHRLYEQPEFRDALSASARRKALDNSWEKRIDDIVSGIDAVRQR